mgnify:FL=1
MEPLCDYCVSICGQMDQAQTGDEMSKLTLKLKDCASCNIDFRKVF